MSHEITHGSCLCGGVRYSVVGPLRSVRQCHCVRCQKFTGNFVAASGALRENITVESVDTVAWFSPPDDANVAYGFCSRCGSSLFWRIIDQGSEAARWAIFAGTLDDDVGLITDEVWFSDHVASYSRLDDSVIHLSSDELG